MIDLVLKSDRLVFELFKLLFELHLDVKVRVQKLDTSLLILELGHIELVHIVGLVLLGDFELSDGLQVALNFVVDTKFLLVQDRLLIQEIIVLSIDVLLCLLLLDQVNLVLNPLLLNLSGVLLDFFNLLLEVVDLILKWSLILVSIATTTTKLSLLTVQMIDLQSLLLDLNVSLLDILLDLGYSLLLILELSDKIIKLLLKDLVLGLGVQIIELDTRDFVSIVLNLNFLI